MKILVLLLITMIFTNALSQAASVCSKERCINVQVVSSSEEMKKGLQGREVLGENEGMLFVFPKDELHRFWMKDMKIPIDMIWIDQQGYIITIAPSRAVCLSDPCEVYSSKAPARYVLEVRSGYALEHGFKEGDLLKIDR